MSDLLNSASLVMIPSGYKEDTVYSVVPSDGSGDLSFTRASNGTRVNSAGLVEVVAWNLLEQSETFTNVIWTANSNTVTANTTTAPNGTTTADTFSLLAGADASIYQAVNGESNNYTTSVYAKYVSGDKYLYFFSQLNSQGAKVWFDIQNGTVSNQLSGFTGTIENAGNGWYKCSIYNTTASASTYIQFGISTTNSSRTISNNSVSYFWGAQVNLGTAKPYFPTTDRLNVPRLTYQNGGGGCPSLLLEKQSTNIVLQSQALAGSPWVIQTGSILDNNTISPDGTQNASKLTDITVYEGMSVDIGATYTATMYAKLGTATNICLVINNQAAWNTVGGESFTTSNGLIANEWARVQFTFTAPITGAINLHIGGHGQTGLTPQSAGTVFVWGVQIEKSSYPTSYIPTTSSSATRVADACSKTGISSLIGQTSGSVFFDFTVDTISAQTNDPVLWYMKDGGTGERYIELYPNGNLTYVEYNGAVIASITKTALTVGRHKCAIAYATDDFVFYVDGVQIGTDTSGTPGAFSTFALQYYSSSYFGQQKVNQVALFKTRLTNAELASITTL